MKKSIAILITIGILLLLSNASPGQTISQWRGTDRHGVYNESGLLTSWPEGGPKLLWSSDTVGNGYGTPAITEDKVYVAGERDSVAYLFTFDRNGKLLWKSDCGGEWVKTFPGSRSTPTVTNDLIYVNSGLGNICCLETNTGVRKWFVDMVKDLHGTYTMHGHSESPLVEGDLVYLTPGGTDTNVVALNRFTGKIVWICKGFGERPAYNSPILVKLAKRELLIGFTAYHMLGIDAKTGELLWSHEQVNIPVAERKMGNGDTHSNSAWYEDGFIYYFAGDGNGAVKLKLAEDGKSISQVWRTAEIDNYMGGFVKSGNYIYSCYWDKRNLISVDAATGMISDSLKLGRGTLIMADKLLYYYSVKGEVYLVKPEGSKITQISMFKITAGTKEHFAHPVIRDGVLYIRHGKSLMAYDIRKK